MNILLCWFQRYKLSSYRRRCIDRVRELYPEANFFIFTDDIHSFPGWILLDVEAYKKHLKEDYLILEEWLQNLYFFTDCLRFYFLSGTPNTLYIDTDTYCVEKIPKLKSKKVGAVQHTISTLYNNNNLEYFTKIFEEHVNDYYTKTLNRLIKYFDFGKSVVDISDYFIHQSIEHGFDFRQEKISIGG